MANGFSSSELVFIYAPTLDDLKAAWRGVFNISDITPVEFKSSGDPYLSSFLFISGNYPYEDVADIMSVWGYSAKSSEQTMRVNAINRLSKRISKV